MSVEQKEYEELIERRKQPNLKHLENGVKF